MSDADVAYVLKAATVFARTIRKSSTLINHFRIAKHPGAADKSHQSVISSNRNRGGKILGSVLRGFQVERGREIVATRDYTRPYLVYGNATITSNWSVMNERWRSFLFA